MAEVQKVVTPKGELEWVTITGEGKENLSGKLQYVANLVLDPANIEEHQEFLDSIEEYWSKNKPKNFKKAPKSMGWYLHDPVLDDDGEPVVDDDGKKTYIAVKDGGKVYLAFKTGTTYNDGKDKVIKTYNAKAKRVDLGEVGIGNGSIGQISGAMGIYTNTTPKGAILDAGVTLYLDGIKIIKLVKYEGPDSGFEAEEEIDEDAFTGVDDEFEGVDDNEGGAAPRL